MPSDLFRAAAETKDGLREFEYDDIGLGWVIHCGYTVDWDGSRADVWIHALTLNTGQHLMPLSLTDIPGEDLKGIEAVIADEVETEAALHCQALARDPADDGDWALDAKRDRDEGRHERVITGTGNASEQRELEALCRALKGEEK